MLYNTITIKDKDYKLRLTARACVDVERKLKTNPMNVFANAVNELPRLEDLLVIIQASLTEYQHGMNMDEVYKWYDEFCEDGGDLEKLINIIFDLFKTAGLIPDEDKSKN